MDRMAGRCSHRQRDGASTAGHRVRAGRPTRSDNRYAAAPGARSTRASTRRSPDHRPSQARVWAALLHAGPPAMASHRTPPGCRGCATRTPTVIQISVPNGHRVTPQPGLRVHHPRAWSLRRQPERHRSPQTRVEDTVLDLVGADAGPRRGRALGAAGVPAPAHDAGPPARCRWAAASAPPSGAVPRSRRRGGDGVASPLERRYRLERRARPRPAPRPSAAGPGSDPTACAATSMCATGGGGCGSSWRDWPTTRWTGPGSTMPATTPPSSPATWSCATAGGR